MATSEILSHTSDVREPPARLLGVLAQIGPGLVVTGSVIGSGELINTPKRAAEFGFVILWAVIVSCFIKWWLQVELGRYCLANNLTTVQALNTLPGPKLRKTHLIPLLYCIGYTFSMATLGGILTATAGLLQSVFPLDRILPVNGVWAWAVITYATTVFLLYRGLYATLQTVVTCLVAGFSLSVLICLALIQFSPYRVHWEQLTGGLTFTIPTGAGYAIISLMGALGTTANEMFMYPYWILEGGYARHVGPRALGNGGTDTHDAWYRRARGWLHVMKVDAFCATALATIITLGYYLVGAAVLAGRDVGGLDVVKDVSRIYTETYGPWSYYVFMFGGFCTLYSTLVVVAAATGRMGADMTSSLGFIRWDDASARNRVIRLFTLAFLTIWLGMAFFMTRPENYVMFGQAINGLINTPLLVIGILLMAFRVDKRLRMGPVATVFLLVSVGVIALTLITSAPETFANLGKVFAGLGNR
jgi:Mn2+/Fe2+ NRAMP family transporter